MRMGGYTLNWKIPLFSPSTLSVRISPNSRGLPLYKHTDSEVSLPYRHLNRGSTSQIDEHPSPSTRLPSSQALSALLMTNPSPQISTQLLFFSSYFSLQTQVLLTGVWLKFPTTLQNSHTASLFAFMVADIQLRTVEQKAPASSPSIHWQTLLRGLGWN